MARVSRTVFMGMSLLTLAFATRAAAIEAHPGMQVEAAYLKAVLAYEKTNYIDSIKLIDRILEDDSSHLPSLELKALILRKRGDVEGASIAYEKLLQHAPAAKHGAYWYELGVIRMKRQEHPKAQEAFRNALSANFNSDSSRFFLGSSLLATGQLVEAETLFSQAAIEGSDELRVTSRYHLGLIHLRKSEPALAAQEFVEARSLATKIGPQSRIAGDITTATTKLLEPYDHARWFGSLSVVGQYDGNVSLIPENVAAVDQTTGSSSASTSLSAGFGRISSPASALQWIGSYRISVNRNFNELARDYEFLSQAATFFLVVDPMARSHFGMKFEGSLVFRNALDDSGVTHLYQPYNLGGELGPYWKSTTSRGIQISAELLARPQNFQEDIEGSSSRRSGIGYLGRFSAKIPTSSRYWNPTGSVGYEYNHSQGLDFRGHTVVLNAADDISVSESTSIAAGAGFSYSAFTQRIPARTDLALSVHGDLTHKFTQNWTALASVTYTRNQSTLPDLFSYTKPQVALGCSYAF